MTEKPPVPKTVEQNPDKAEAMAYAENGDRTRAAYADAAAGIIDSAATNDESAQAITEAANAAKRIASQGGPNNWDEQKAMHGGQQAETAWMAGLDANAHILDAKDSEDFVADSAIRELNRTAKGYRKDAEKAGKLAGKSFDKAHPDITKKSDVDLAV